MWNWWVKKKYRSRFFVQVGNETAMGNHHFSTKTFHHQTYQDYSGTLLNAVYLLALQSSLKILVDLTMTLYSEKMMISHSCFIPSLHKKSWMVFILYSPISHLSPESLAKHIHFPVFLSQIWSVVLSLGQLQAVKIKDKKLQLIAY